MGNEFALENEITVNPEIRYTRVITEEKYEFRGHRHNYWELKVVFSGSLETTVDDTVMKLTPCEIMLIEPGIFHREITDGADYMALQLDLQGVPDMGKMRVSELSQNDLSLVKLVRFYSESLSKNIENKSSHPKNERLYHKSVSLEPERAKHTLVKLIEVLLHSILNGHETETPINNRFAVVYNKSVNYMLENMDKNLSIDDISKNAGVCRTVVKNAFSRYTGHGVIKHFNYMKMIRAKALLDEGIPASEIANLLGFSSQSYFTQSFVRECGCTPSEYKKQK